MNVEKIKEAARDFNEWQGKAVIMYDSSDGDVWTDVFSDDTTYESYHSETIFHIWVKGNFLGRNNKVSVENLEKAIKYIEENDVKTKDDAYIHQFDIEKAINRLAHA